MEFLWNDSDEMFCVSGTNGARRLCGLRPLDMNNKGLQSLSFSLGGPLPVQIVVCHKCHPFIYLSQWVSEWVW